VFTFTSMIRLPQPIQDSGVQIFLIGFFGFLIRLHIRLFRLSSFLVALPAFVVIVSVHLLTLSSRNKERVRFLKTHPLSEDHQQTPSSPSTQIQAGESKNDDHPPLSVLNCPPNSLSSSPSRSVVPISSLLGITPAFPSVPVNEPEEQEDLSPDLIWESSDDEEEDEQGNRDIYEISSESDPLALRDETRAASCIEEEVEEDSSDGSQEEFSDSSSVS
jgi:hypothetical protein